MTSEQIRKSFLEFFEKKGHKIVPSSSLIPDDKSVLLTTAGMQQFKKYYTGELNAKKDFVLENGEPAIGVASVQKCFRTSDIDEVGDDTHLTFFEMLGNFSFGGYFKKEAIEYAHEFITKELKLKIHYVSVFKGDEENNIPADEESEKIWKEIDSDIEIRKAGKEDNFWGPTGDEGPCGPTTEIYINGVEVWNIVFNEYYRDKKGRFIKSENLGVDTGMGLERLAMVMQNVPTIFQTDLFKDAFKRDFNGPSGRIFLDHIRGAMFLIADGINPLNKGAGYVLRRLIRRAIFHVRKMTGEDEGGGISIGMSEIQLVVESGISFYKSTYNELKEKKEIILEIFKGEYEQFTKTLNVGIREFNSFNGKISPKDAFRLFQSFGLPKEVMKDLCKEKGIKFDDLGFEEEFAKHQELSRTASAGMFKGGLADAGEQTIKYHTAAHLMLAALRQVLGEGISQKGSNITAERMRFDFSYPEKMTPEQIRQVEDLVNEKIKQDLPVVCEEMDLDEAKKQNATGVFDSKYGDRVKVYTIMESPSTSSGSAFSREICGGPHVNRTSELGVFKITKEESASAGTRRIRAVLS